MITSKLAIAARAKIPREYTRRLPRYVIWRGKKPSPAVIALKRGKSANAVFAAIINMTVVPAITRIYPNPFPEKMVRPIWEMIVSSSDGIAPICRARKVIPSSKEPRIADIITRVCPAVLLRGSLKAVIPSEMASIPVTADVPLENALKIKKIDNG